jgi:F-type H+-transporting ATPase subunit delta
MADRATIARPYARAAFAHAHAGKELPAWSKLLGAAAIAAADARVARLIGHPQVTGRELVERAKISVEQKKAHQPRGAA